VPDRYDIATLNVLFVLARLALLDHGVKKHRLPGLEEFIPMPPDPEPEWPTDFESRARLLLMRFAG
jgi:hypothetical protein